MSIKDILSQFDEFFDLSKKKQRKKLDKLTKIIESLEEKKALLKKAIQKESKINKDSKFIYDSCKEFKVLSKLIKKAKKHYKKLDKND